MSVGLRSGLSGERGKCQAEGKKSTKYGVRSAEQALVIGYSLLRTVYFVLRALPSPDAAASLRFSLAFRTVKQRGARFARGPFVQFPNLIGPVGNLAKVLGPGARLDHGTDKSNRHLRRIVDLYDEPPVAVERLASRQLEDAFRPLASSLPEQEIGETADGRHGDGPGKGSTEYGVRSTEYGVRSKEYGVPRPA